LAAMILYRYLGQSSPSTRVVVSCKVKGQIVTFARSRALP
jgi:hypothetical protein